MSGGLFNFNPDDLDNRGNEVDKDDGSGAELMDLSDDGRDESDGRDGRDERDERDERDDEHIKETRNVMTKYERTRIIGARATLLAGGAQPLVNVDGEKDLLKIAEKELYAGVLPIIITRYLPNGVCEEWAVQDLILP